MSPWPMWNSTESGPSASAVGQCRRASAAPTQRNLQLRAARLRPEAPDGCAGYGPARTLPATRSLAPEIQASATPVSRSDRETPDERIAAWGSLGRLAKD